MAEYFRAPDTGQVVWLVESKRYGEYLSILASLHEVLCLWARDHGFPQGLKEGEDLTSHRQRLVAQLADLSLDGFRDDVRLDITQNRSATLALLKSVEQTSDPSEDANNFLRVLVDSYAFVLRQVPRPPRP